MGGESIIVNGVTIYNHLKKNNPDVIKILSNDFLWEYKGVQKNKYYHEPVLKLIDNIPMWRYLRDYIEGASIKKKVPLSSEKIWAMDCLDSLLDSSEFQLRSKFKTGDTMFINDRNVFHGRTCFVDPQESDFFADANERRSSDLILRRTGLRIWINSTY